jgi:hypothetical protein
VGDLVWAMSGNAIGIIANHYCSEQYVIRKTDMIYCTHDKSNESTTIEEGYIWRRIYGPKYPGTNPLPYLFFACIYKLASLLLQPMSGKTIDTY